MQAIRMNRTAKDLYRPSWAEVDLKAVAHNFKEIKRLVGKKTAVLSVVKADAYGHGMLEVARLLERLGADFFGVADINEGMLLRKNGIRKPIVLFESQLPGLAGPIVDFRLRPTVSTVELAATLNRYAKTKNKRIPVHVKVDTGMGRLGVWHEEAISFIGAVSQLRHLFIEGICTHFAAADTDRIFTKGQIDAIFTLVRRLKERGLDIPYIHAANSVCLIDYKDDVCHFNLARPGLILYGLYPTPALKTKINLRPALSVKSRIVFLKKVAKGRSISYGRTFIARKNMTVATIPVGYNDGYFRSLSSKSSVLVDGVRCPPVCRITMDQMMVDVTRVKSPRLGTEVVLLGRQKGAYITADEIAEWAATINYEITCSLGNRLPRIY